MPSKLNKFVKNKEMSSQQEIDRAKKEQTEMAEKAFSDHVRFDRILPNENNLYAEYDTQAEIEELADSIARSGLLHNLVVSLREDGTYMLISGERRLKAIKLLMTRDAAAIEKWAQIPCTVYRGLNDVDEIIMLDAANLETRGGGSGDAKMIRKATIRYVDNLKARYGISQKAADELAKQNIQMNARTVERNLKIERDLLQPLKDLFDEGAFQRDEALCMCGMTPNEQSAAAKTLTAIYAKEGRSAAFQKAKDYVVDAAKAADDDLRGQLLERAGAVQSEIKKTNPVISESEVALRVYDKNIVQVNKMLKQVQKMSKKATLRTIVRLDDKNDDKTVKSLLEELDRSVQKLLAQMAEK